MNFQISRNKFLDGIQKTLGIVEKKTTLTVLNNILIKTEPDQIKIVATDSEISLVSYYDAKIINNGMITVPARIIFEMVREIEGDVIEFQVMENNLVNVTCDKVIYKIPGTSADDFPKIMDVEDGKSMRLECKTFKQIIEKTFFAISTDEMRPNLNGVFLKVKDDNVTAVATDGHRLSIVTKPLSEDHSKDNDIEGIIIPRKGVSEIKKFIEDGEYINTYVDEGVFVVSKKDTTLRVSLIDADYPDYSKVIPGEGGTEIQLDNNQILHSLRRMSVMSSDKYNGVQMNIYDNKLELTSTNPDIGEAKDEIDISYSGDLIETGYNVRYLIDAMDPIGDKVISFEVRSENGPGVIKSAGKNDYMCVIMPVKMRKD